MKKNLLFAMCMAAGISAFAQFKPGNLAVYRYGNGAAMVSGARVPVFIDEYNPATGLVVNTITIPQTASGSNYGINGLGLTNSNGYEAEGFPVLSRDGQTLSIFGYDAATTTSPFKYVVGIINVNGNVNSSTVIEEAIGAPRSAVLEGTKVYAHGNTGGILYKEIGAVGASIRVSATPVDAPRVLTIAETTYGGETATRLYSPVGGTSTKLYAVTPLPTTSVNFYTVPEFQAAQLPVNIHQVAAINAYGRTIVYFIDDNNGSPLIRKYRSNDAGTNWVELGSVSVPFNTKSLTAQFSGTGVRVYYTTMGTPGNTNSQLFSLVDNFTSSNTLSKSITGLTPTLIATAPANTTFRGVTMAPIANPLPVTLTSFDAKESQKNIKLNWSTSSEKNSSHFDILKSYDGKEFQKIGEVKAAGDSDNNKDYFFIDENPFPGVNYYKLQQFDKNGTATFYGPKQVTSKVEKTDFNIYASASKSVADLFVYSTIKQQGKIRILSIGGQVLHEESLSMEKGYSKISLPVNFIKTGVQVAVLNAQSETITKKFIWQQ